MNDVEMLYAALMKTTLLMNDSNDQFFQRYNLGTTRYFALVHMNNAPGLSLSDLSTLLLCTKGNATRILKSLEGDGLVVREMDVDDNRAVRLFLTTGGSALLQRVNQDFLDFNQKRFACLKDAAKTSLYQHLISLNANVSAQIQSSQD
jgi:MarR family 2-MHQ and catechol resistance regulon transcriptional repressor